MKHPYDEFEQTPLWKTIETAVAELKQNRDIEVKTTQEHFIGYLCQRLATQRLVVERSLLRE